MKNIIEQMNESLENKYFLKEAAQDKQNFINFAGKDLADRFEKLKDANRVKNDTESGRNYADYYYWMHQPIDRLIDYVNTLEDTVSDTKARKKSESEIKKEGAKLIADADGWKVYKILTPEAAQLYGRSTTWCLTDNDIKRSTYNFNNYKLGGVRNYCFLIPDNDPYGKWCYLDYGREAYRDAGAEVFRDSQDNKYTVNDVLRRREIPLSILHSLPGLRHRRYTEKGLSESFLTEGKEDEEKFIAFAGEDLANRFNELKRNNRVRNDTKTHQNYADYGYWETLPFGRDELERYVTHLENTPSRGMSKKGADRVYEGNGWKIYLINTYDAAKYYGENTTWCITGRYEGEESRGKFYFDDYKRHGVENYYFLIPDSDPYGKWCYLEYSTEEKRKNEKIFFNAKNKSFNMEAMQTVSRHIPTEVLNALPYLENYKPYTDKGNAETIYRERGEQCAWSVRKTISEEGYAHYSKFCGKTPAGNPECCYMILRNRTPWFCYYYYDTFEEAKKRPVFCSTKFNTEAKSRQFYLSDLSHINLPRSVVEQLPYVKSILDNGDELSGMINDGILTYDEGYDSDAIALCANLITGVFVPKTVHKIQDWAFYNIDKITSVVFENGSELKEIGKYAFYFTNITDIDFPGTLEVIGEEAFTGCQRLSRVSFGGDSALRLINNRAFYYCTAIGEITVPRSVERIGWEAFKSCKALTSVMFERGSQLRQMGSAVFDNCAALRQITIPSGVSSIREGCFSECESLSFVSFDSGSELTSLSDAAFGCTTALREITLPPKMKYISDTAFDNSGVEHIILTGGYDPHLFDKASLIGDDVVIDFVNAGVRERWGDFKTNMWTVKPTKWQNTI